MAIIGSLDNLDLLYKQLPQPAWRAVFSWLPAIPVSDQDNTFCHPDFPTIQAHLKTMATARPDQNRYASHLLHIDIHICLSGSEIIQVAPIDQLSPISHHPAADYTLYNPPRKPLRSVVMLPRCVAVFFPPDAHQPGLPHSGNNFVQKLIVKIPLSLLA